MRVTGFSRPDCPSAQPRITRETRVCNLIAVWLESARSCRRLAHRQMAQSAPKPSFVLRRCGGRVGWIADSGPSISRSLRLREGGKVQGSCAPSSSAVLIRTPSRTLRGTGPTPTAPRVAGRPRSSSRARTRSSPGTAPRSRAWGSGNERGTELVGRPGRAPARRPVAVHGAPRAGPRRTVTTPPHGNGPMFGRPFSSSARFHPVRDWHQFVTASVNVLPHLAQSVA